MTLLLFFMLFHFYTFAATSIELDTFEVAPTSSLQSASQTSALSEENFLQEMQENAQLQTSFIKFLKDNPSEETVEARAQNESNLLQDLNENPQIAKHLQSICDEHRDSPTEILQKKPLNSIKISNGLMIFNSAFFLSGGFLFATAAWIGLFFGSEACSFL